MLEITMKAAITLAITSSVFFMVYRKNPDAITIMKTLKVAFMKKAKSAKQDEEHERHPQ